MAYRETPYVRAKKEEKRLRILAAAEEAFAEKGFGGTSTRELIQRSGHSTTAFYTHFSQKEDVLAALVEEISLEIREAIQKGMREGRDTPERIFLSFMNTFAVYKDHKALAKILLGEALSFTGPAGEKARALYHGVAEITRHELSLLRKQGMLGDIDLDAFAYGMIGAVNFQIFRWAVWEEISLPELERLIAETGRMIVAGILPRRMSPEQREHGPAHHPESPQAQDEPREPESNPGS